MPVAHLVYRSRWSAVDLEQFPSEFHAEIVHGALRVNPSPSARHRLLPHMLAKQLEPQLPDGWTTAFDFDLILAEDHARRPDMAIVRVESYDVDPTPASEVAIIVEVVSPGSETTDRRDKPEEYAKAGIPVYWRIETTGPPALFSYERVGSSYFEHAPATGTFTTQQPWPIKIDVPDLGRISPRR